MPARATAERRNIPHEAGEFKTRHGIPAVKPEFASASVALWASTQPPLRCNLLLNSANFSPPHVRPNFSIAGLRGDTQVSHCTGVPFTPINRGMPTSLATCYNSLSCI